MFFEKVGEKKRGTYIQHSNQYKLRVVVEVEEEALVVEEVEEDSYHHEKTARVSKKPRPTQTKMRKSQQTNYSPSSKEGSSPHSRPKEVLA